MQAMDRIRQPLSVQIKCPRLLHRAGKNDLPFPIIHLYTSSLLVRQNASSVWTSGAYPFGKSPKTMKTPKNLIHNPLYPQAVGLWVSFWDGDERPHFSAKIRRQVIKICIIYSGSRQELNRPNANIQTNGVFSTGVWMIPRIHPQFIQRPKCSHCKGLGRFSTVSTISTTTAG